jgi:RNA polymerase sigma factor (sigma-70 family)
MSVVGTMTYDVGARPSPVERLARWHDDFSGNIGQYLRNLTCGLLPPLDVDDVYGETIETLLRLFDRPGFEPTRPLGLFKTVAYRKAQDALRQRGRSPSTNADDLLAQVEDGPEAHPGRRHGPDPWDEARRAEFRVRLLRALQGLPPRERLVAQLYIEHHEEFGERDIYERLTAYVSAATGQAENVATVKSLWHAARKRLVVALAPDYPEVYSGPSRPSPPRGVF